MKLSVPKVDINTTEYVTGLSAYYHRLLLGHDPILGFAVGGFDIMTGRMTTIDKTGETYSWSYKDGNGLADPKICTKT